MKKRKMLLLGFLIAVLFTGIYSNNFFKKVPILYSIQKTISSPVCDSRACFSKKQASLVPAGFCLPVPVLMYHHIQPDSLAKSKFQTALSVDSMVFDQQMAYLASNGYVALSADELIQALVSHSQLPVKSIVITLDDGYKDAYEYAYPVFQKYQLKANLMIAPGLLGGSDYLSWSQIEEMSRNSLITITNHTWSHFAVGNADKQKITYEIETAANLLEQHTGKKPTIFTYPYGSFGNDAISLLQELGYTGGFSTLPGTIQCESFVMTLHRTRIGNSSLSFYGL